MRSFAILGNAVIDQAIELDFDHMGLLTVIGATLSFASPEEAGEQRLEWPT
jgi:hypothetical protein